MGITMFLEQVPIVDPNEASPLPYRTHIINRDLQIWLTDNGFLADQTFYIIRGDRPWRGRFP